MAIYKIVVKYKKNRKTPLSPGELKQRYFFGIPVTTPEGTLISDEELEFHINSAVKEMEAELGLQLPLQVISEKVQFERQQYNEWSHIRVNYPAVCVHSVEGFVGTIRQATYPKEWFSIHQSNDGLYHRNINLVPNSLSTVVDFQSAFIGIYPNKGFLGNNKIPNYWTIIYTTGFQKIPDDILKAIGMKASIPIFDLLGDIVIGAGIASQSLGVDGLSQSVTTTSSAENSAYSARIKSYNAQLKELMPALKQKYRGFIFETV